MTDREVKAAWNFFDVGKHWLGRRACGKVQVRAKTRGETLEKARQVEIARQQGETNAKL
jgi:hypothetical protein